MDPQQQNVPTPDIEQPANPTQGVKQQIVDRITSAKNVLITVGIDSSVDDLASALALTFLLDKLNKHVAAVFSGKVPPAIEFLDPQAVFETSIDGLRDFVIALDKEKADKLRYKVEDEVVKIFITPYKTTLSEKDLEFSQGDFNVDVVIALGVKKREALDRAIIAHGRILHDATVITINAEPQTSDLGVLNWNDPAASSISEMLMSISESFGGGLLDAQISTALLTGLVAQTNRFSNEKTSPKVMTMAAQLMAAGANQQLVASNLRQEGMISEPIRGKDQNQPHDDNGEIQVAHEADNKNTVNQQDSPNTQEAKKGQTESQSKTQSSHSKNRQKNQQNDLPKDNEEPPVAVTEDPQVEAVKDALNEARADDLVVQTTPPTTSTDEEVSIAPPPELQTEDLPTLPPVPSSGPIEPPSITPPSTQVSQTGSMNHVVIPTNEPMPVTTPQMDGAPQIMPTPSHAVIEKPTFGGTLNATTSSAEEDRIEQETREATENHVALEHQVESPEAAVESARQAVFDATTSQPFDPSNQPLESLGAQPFPDETPSPVVDKDVSSIQSPPVALPNLPSVADSAPVEPTPVDAFMQPHQNVTPNIPGNSNSLPPLPPLPGDMSGMPPMPPLPGQPSDSSGAFQPQINPGFMQNMPQSQNSWTEAGEDMAAKQAAAKEDRQARLDKLSTQYDSAVERNQEIQQQQAQLQKSQTNPDDHTVFPLPPQY